MVGLKNAVEKIVLLIVLFSTIISFCVIPASYAKLDIADDEFYYAGTQKGQYTVKEGIFSWLLSSLADVADWIVGMVLMAIRAPFVGYTALIERTLTWALQTTSGLTQDNTISNTDWLQTITTSKNNVTIEAIVYNRVPAFDINFFNTEYDTTYSPTGQKYVCEKCNKTAEECCTVDDEGKVTCSCGCNGTCDNCKNYGEITHLTKVDINDNTPEGKEARKKLPVIIQLKIQIAQWYYIIRLIALAGMLVVLVGIGIKMLISNIASDKALYKRMLIDWVVGVIIIFMIHYFMYFAIMINDILVDVVRNSAEETHKVTMMQLAEKGNEQAEYSNLDLETSIYEEIRTRAYDPKLVNGIIGMVLYMALVFMAFKYSFIYAKRFFTVAILMLMGPGVGVAYAFQKAITGKSFALKKWMSEVILNIIIQTVHAIIYAVFISTVLYLSLESIAGVIIALIVMNFASKAEALFRRIFNLDPNGKGLLSDTENAGNLEQKYSNMIAMYKGGRTAAKALSNSPVAQVYKGAARIGVSAGVLAIGGAAKASKEAAKLGEKVASKIPKTSEGVKREREIDKEMEREEEETDYDFSSESEEQYEARRARAAARVDDRKAMKGTLFKKAKALVSPLRSAYVNRHTSEELMDRFEKAKKAYEEDPNSLAKANAYIDAYNDVQRKQQIGDITLGGIALGHIDRVFNIENYFQIRRKPNGKTTMSLALKPGSIFGTKSYNPKTGKVENNKDSIIDQFRAQNLLGFTEQDSKVFKQNVTNNLKNGFIGTAAMFVGMGTFVVNPKLGMGLIAYGAPKKYGSFQKLGYLPRSRKYNSRRYTYNSFTMPTIRNMTDIALNRAKFEKNKLVVQNVKTRHPKLFKRLRMGTVAAVTLGGFSVAGLPGGAIAYLGIGALDGIRRRFKRLRTTTRESVVYAVKKNEQGKEEIVRDENGNPVVKARVPKGLLMVEDPYERNPRMVSEAENNINKQYFNQLKTQEKKFVEDAFKVMAQEAIIDVENASKKMHEEELKKEYEEMGYNYDPETGVITRIVKQEEYLEEERGKSEIEVDEFTEESSSKFTDTDIREVNRTIEDILLKVSSSQALDINDEARINQVLKLVDAQLYAANILTGNQKTVDIFKGGRKGLIKAIKKKTSYINTTIEVSTSSAFDGMPEDEAKVVKDLINQTVTQDGAKRASVSTAQRRNTSNTPTTMTSNTPVGGTVGNVEIQPTFGNNQSESSNETESVQTPVSPRTKVNQNSKLDNNGSIIEESTESGDVQEASTLETRSINVNVPEEQIGTVDVGSLIGIDFRNVETEVIVEEVLSKIESNLNSSSNTVVSKIKKNRFGGFRNESTPKKLTEEQKEKYTKAITKYVETMKKLQNAEVPTSSPEKEIKLKTKPIERKQVEEKARAKVSKRMRKLEEIAKSNIDNVDAALRVISEDEDTSGLNQASVAETLILLANANEVNKLARETYEVKENKAGRKAMEMEYSAGREYLPLALEVESFKRDNADLYFADFSSLSEEDKLKVKRIKDIEAQLPDKKRGYDEAIANRRRAGAINMNNLLNIITHVH